MPVATRAALIVVPPTSMPTASPGVSVMARERRERGRAPQAPCCKLQKSCRHPCETTTVVPMSSIETQVTTATAPEDASPEWWRHAVIYQVYPRSFADSDGDGIGDLAGVRSRLPYLRDLGVDAVWLSPFYASPQADAGYDVSDYRRVDPMFGDIDDAAGLIEDAHALDLRVIVDLVPNHCSDQHEWFQRALRAVRGRRCASGSTSSPDAVRAAHCPRTTGSRSSADRRGRGLRMGGVGTSTCSPRSSRTSTGTTRPSTTSSARSCASGSTSGSTASGSTCAHGLVKAPGLPDAGDADQLKLLGNQADAVLRPGRRARDLPRLAPGPRRVRRRADLRRRGLDPHAPARRELRPRRRAPPGLQLLLPVHRLGRRRPSPHRRPHASTRWARSVPRPRGCCPTTTSPGTPPASRTPRASASSW